MCKVGESFICLKTIINGYERYTKGKTYKCNKDNCLIDNSGNSDSWENCSDFNLFFEKLSKNDNVNHPKHYTSHPSGIECITITRHHNFNIGNAIKYLWRQGLKPEEGMSDTVKQIEDLKKAIWYITDEIGRLENVHVNN